MRLPLLVVVIGVLVVVDCLDFPDGIEEDRHSVEETRLLKIRETQIEESDEEMFFNDHESVSRQRVCSPTPSCVLAGGHCIRRDGTCHGTRDPRGCRGRRCTCCIPDITPPTCPPPPECPTFPAVTSGRIKDSVLEWNFVDEDYFVRFNERMTWDDGKDFCTIFGLELYHPKNITKIAKYIADNFESYDQHRNFIGGRGNGTHLLWLSGEVVSGDEPWANNYTRRVSINDCLAVDIDPLRYRPPKDEGVFLWSTPCSHVSQLDYILCGDSQAHGLTWHSVGEDKFARYDHRMDWEDSRKLCNIYGLDLYQPKNLTAVSAYLSGLYIYDKLPKDHSYHWLGAKGNGTHILWVSGEVLPNSPLWYFYWTYENRCVIIKNSNSDGEIVLPTICSYRFSYPLCG